MTEQTLDSGAPSVKEPVVVQPNPQRAAIRYLLAEKGKTQRDVKVAAEKLLGPGVTITEALVSYVISGARTEGEKVDAIRHAIARITKKPLSELFED